MTKAAQDYVIRAESLFRQMYNDPEAFRDRIKRGILFMGPDPHFENKLSLMGNGFFSLELFQAMICGGESYESLPIPFLWDRLVERRVMVKAFGSMKGAPFVDHHIDHSRLHTHLRDETFRNLFAPPSALCERYKHAVASVDVLVDGKHSRGTGFIVRLQSQRYFVTCRHNIDPDKGIVVRALTTAAGSSLEVEDFVLSDQYDIAVARVRSEIVDPSFAFFDDVEVFDEVFTLGFPYIPCAEPLLLGHRGEVNGMAHLYIEKCPVLIISNLVSPGSSGGPVLSSDGHCVGMTIDWLEGKWGDQTMRFSAALPARLLREAVDKLPKG